jgi:UDP-2,4-diacetamido-2,4,6-trideoxy-beta-L-altropyranose hydrolase
MISGKRKVLFRADGDARIGLGHLHRCISLAEILQVDFYCTFAIRHPLPGIRKLVASYGFNLTELTPVPDYEAEARELASLDFDIFVLDGYQFNTTYQQQILNSGKKLVCIDDLHTWHFLAHAVINPAGNVKPEMYSVEPYTRLFLGNRFCLVKKIFREMAANRTRLLEREDAIFVCVGGADTSRNDTLKILQVCERSTVKHWHYYVILGEAYPFLESVRNFILQTSMKITLLTDLPPKQMALYMSRCKAAVCPPSGLAYEYISIGGILYLLQVAENQADTLAYLIHDNLAFLFSEFPVAEDARIQDVLVNQQAKFDGQSDIRLLNIFRGLLNVEYTLRPVDKSDVVTLFQWANDSIVRQNAINSMKILWEDHVKWYHTKLRSLTSFMYVLEENGVSVGQIRFDLCNRIYLIDYSIDSRWRGKGLGKKIVQEGIAALRRHLASPIILRAEVCKSNAASIKVFLAEQFSQTEERQIEGRLFLIFERII